MDTELQVVFRRNLKLDNETLFGWKSLPKTTCKGYKLYHSSNIDGPFLLFSDFIQNQAQTEPPYKGKILFRVLDSQIPIPALEDHFFKLTVINNNNVESSIADSPPKVIHPPEIDNVDHGQNSTRYVFNFCWDENTHRWVKSRALTERQYFKKIINSSQQIITFPTNVIRLEIQNESPTAVLRVNLNAEDINSIGGIPIFPYGYYVSACLIPGNVGISLVSTENNTPVTMTIHY